VVSATENELAAVKLEFIRVFATPVEVAVIVQVVVFVCTMPVIAEMFVNVKSVPFVVDKVAQFIASLPVTVKVIVAEPEVAAERAKVTVGAVRSTEIVKGEPARVV
jgi:uncharacterized membrane protein